MIFLLLADLYAFLLPLGFGVWFLQFVWWVLQRHVRAAVPGILATWLGGLLLLTVGLQGWSLLAPIHTAAHLAAGAVGLAGLAHPAGRQLLGRLGARLRQLHPATRGLGLLLTLVVLAVSTFPPTNVDTGLYHAQALRWLEEMGVVPGLANAEIHLGFNSAWFVPEALFSWGRYLGSPLQVLNGLLFMLFGWYGLAGLDQVLRGRFRPADLLRAVLVLFGVVWLLYDVPSLSPDPAVALVVLFLVVQALALPTPAGQRLTLTHAALLLLMGFAATLKLSTVPVLLLGVWWLVRSGQYRNLRLLGLLAALGGAVVLPWLGRNYVISGYPVFPATAFGFLHPDWQFPLHELALHNDYIKEFARNELYYSEIVIHDKPLSFWLPLWWRQQYVLHKVLLLALPTLLVLAGPLAWWQHRRGRLPQRPELLAALGVAGAGVAFWFALAPALRFGFGFLLAALALLVLPGLWEAARRNAPLVAGGLGAALVAGLLLMPLLVEYRLFHVPHYLLPAEYRSFLHQLPRAADRAFVRRQYPHPDQDTIWEKENRPARERVQLLALLARSGGIPLKGGLDDVSGRSGLYGLPRQLVWPARYPVVPLRPVALPPLRLLENPGNRQFPFYAPFPFTPRPRFCQPRGPRLADGFRARAVPGVRNWRKEARW